MGPRTSRVHEILNVTHTWSDTSWLFWGWVRLISPNSTCRIDEKTTQLQVSPIFFRIFEDFVGFCLRSDTVFPSSRCRVFHQPRESSFGNTWGFFKRLRDWSRLGLNSLVCPSAEGNLIGFSQDHQAKLSVEIDLTKYWSWSNSHPPLPPSYSYLHDESILNGYSVTLHFTSLPSGRKKGHQALKPCWKSC